MRARWPPPASARSDAASACSPASGACGCRCRSPACRTATRGRSRPATGSCCSTAGCTSPGSLAHLERAMDQVNLRLEHVRLLVITHAHVDHYGQAATIVERAGLRAVDAPEPRARDARGRGPRGGARSGASRSPARPACPPSRSRRGRAGAARAATRHRRPGRRPTAPLLPGVEVRTDLGAWLVRRDAGPRAVARLPVPARAAPADQRRPPPRPRLALLRLRLVAGPRRRVPGLARRASRPTAPRLCLPGHGRTFTDVGGAHRRQPRARLRAPRAPGRRRCASDGPLTAFEAVPRRPTSGRRPRRRQLVAAGDALLPAPPRGHRPGRAASATSRTAPSAGALSAEPTFYPSRRAHRRAARPAEPPGVLLRVLPAEDRGGPAQPLRRRRRARSLRPDYVSVTYGAGGSTAAQDDRDRLADQARSTASRRWRTSRASASTVDELRDDARARCASRRRQRPRAARRPARRPGRVGRRPRAAWSTRASSSSSSARDYAVRDRRGVLPRDAHPRDERRGRPALPQGEGRRGRAVPHHAALLRQRAATSTSSTAPARHRHRRADHPGDHADHERQAARAHDVAVRRDDPRPPARASSTPRADEPDAVGDFGVAYATLQCAELLARRRARASTSTR